MGSIFSPKIARLADIGKSVALGDLDSIEALRDSVKDCNLYIADFERIFLNFAPYFSSDEEKEQLVNFVLQDFKDLKRTFEDLEGVIDRKRFIELNPVIYSIEKYAVRMAESVDALSKAGESIESPIPVINLLIKFSYGVTEKKCSDDELVRLIPGLVMFISCCEFDIARFKSLYEKEKEIIKTAEKLIGDLKEAAGAFVLYNKEKKAVCLVDAVRILKFASPPLYMVLKLMDAVAAQNKEFSEIPAVEDFCRTYEMYKSKKISAEKVVFSLINISRTAKVYEFSVEYAKSIHYYPFIEEQWKSSYGEFASFKAFWKVFYERAKKQPLPYDLNLRELCSNFDSACKTVNRLSCALKKEFDKVAKTPYMEELKEIICRYLSGSIVLEYFSTRLEDFSLRHQELLFQFRDKAVNNALAKEVYELLELQKTGVDELMMFLEDSDKKHLIVGMRDIEASLPRLLEIQYGISPLKKSSRTVCPGCGFACPMGERICPKCGVVVPKIISANLSGAQDEFFEEEALPARLELLFNAVQAFQAGNMSPKELSSEFKKYRSILKQVRKEYNARAKDFLKAPNQEMQEYASTFDSSLGRLEKCVDNIVERIDSGRDIDEEMSQLRFTGYCLEDLRGLMKS